MSCQYKRPYLYADCCPNYPPYQEILPCPQQPPCPRPQAQPCASPQNCISIKIEGIIKIC